MRSRYNDLKEAADIRVGRGNLWKFNWKLLQWNHLRCDALMHKLPARCNVSAHFLLIIAHAKPKKPPDDLIILRFHHPGSAKHAKCSPQSGSVQVQIREVSKFGQRGIESDGLPGGRLLHEETVSDVLCNGFHQERRHR